MTRHNKNELCFHKEFIVMDPNGEQITQKTEIESGCNCVIKQDMRLNVKQMSEKNGCFKSLSCCMEKEDLNKIIVPEPVCMHLSVAW